MHTLLRKLNSFFARGYIAPSPGIPIEGPISDEIFNNYSFVIGSLFSYFNDLSADQKTKFVKRVHHFKSNKKFHFIGLENNEDMAILVSA